MFVRKMLSNISGLELHYLFLILMITVVHLLQYSSLKQKNLLGLHQVQCIIQLHDRCSYMTDAV